MKKKNKVNSKKKLYINDKQLKYTIIFIVVFLILVIGATFAYFAITSVNNATPTTITGTGEEIGTPTLITNTTSLSLNLTADLMSEKNSGKRLYATKNINEPYIIKISGQDRLKIPLNEARYELATASVTEGTAKYDCEYNFDITASVAKEITDGSDQDVFVIIIAPNGSITRYSLAQILEKPRTLSGVIKELDSKASKTFTIESYAYNITNVNQNGLSDNSYSISIVPRTDEEGFNCNFSKAAKIEGLAKYLIDNKLIEKDSIYNYFPTYLYKGEKADNYICFGTTNKSDCTSNPDKYMYRILGIFPDEYSNQYVKLIKNTSIGKYQYHRSSTKIVDWEDTQLYKGINGSYFLTNTTYDYLQNSTWLNKIKDWNWTEAMMNAYSRGSQYPNEYSESPASSMIAGDPELDYNTLSNYYTTCYWSHAFAKIGLINGTEYGHTFGTNGSNKVSWLINSSSSNTWKINMRLGHTNMSNYVPTVSAGVMYYVSGSGASSRYSYTTERYDVRPSFYLEGDIDLNSGTGTEEDPYILK